MDDEYIRTPPKLRDGEKLYITDPWRHHYCTACKHRHNSSICPKDRSVFVQVPWARRPTSMSL